MRKVHRKLLATALAASLAIGSLAGGANKANAEEASADSRTVIADPAYFYDFEGDTPLASKGTASATAEVKGAGTVVDGIFDNNTAATASAMRQNYLSLPSSVADTITSNEKKEVTIAMRVKAPEGSTEVVTVNEVTTGANYGFHSPLFVMKSSTNTTQSWPLCNVSLKGGAQINWGGFVDVMKYAPETPVDGEWYNNVAYIKPESVRLNVSVH